MSVPNIDLSDKRSIPQIGLGLWQIKDKQTFENTFNGALEAGYRHFDTAQAYNNEHFLGELWQKSGLKREDLFITTKIAVQHFGYRRTKSSFKTSLNKLNMEYVDLLLLHFPIPILRKKSWKALEALLQSGKVKSIGVSNYTIKHLEKMKSYANVMPVVNQVELHIFLQQPELVKYCKNNNIMLEAYSPLAHAKSLDNHVVSDVAKKYHKTYAQVMLRWLIQQDLVVLPKSVTLSRIRENIDIFDFALDQDDLESLSRQDKNMRTCWSPVHIP
jgi:diketogulonate reductase-like aldo/keto reductase